MQPLPLAAFLLGCLLLGLQAFEHDASTSVHHSRRLLEIGCASGCQVTTLFNDAGTYQKQCKVTLKKDLTDHNLSTEPADHPCRCCFRCSEIDNCKAWVYKTDEKKCYFKSATYDSCKKVECGQCIASNPSGETEYSCTKTVSEEEWWSKSASKESSSHSASSEGAGSSKSSSSSQKPSKMATLAELKKSAGESKYGKGVLVAQTSSPNSCCFSEGFDQPAEYNLLDKALILTTAYACCDACRQNNMCKSWVWKRGTFECFLKNNYVASENDIVCATCIAYKQSSSFYLYVKKSESASSKEHAGEERHTKETESYSGSYTTSKPAETGTPPAKTGPSTTTTIKFGGSIGKASTGERCAFIEGYNIPAAFDISKTPIVVKAAYMCCDKCKENDKCKSWVWKKTSHECYLKNNYDYRRAKEIKCEECVAYSSSGKSYVYKTITTTTTETTKSKTTASHTAVASPKQQPSTVTKKPPISSKPTPTPKTVKTKKGKGSRRKGGSKTKTTTPKPSSSPPPAKPPKSPPPPPAKSPKSSPSYGSEHGELTATVSHTVTVPSTEEKESTAAKSQKESSEEASQTETTEEKTSTKYGSGSGGSKSEGTSSTTKSSSSSSQKEKSSSSSSGSKSEGSSSTSKGSGSSKSTTPSKGSGSSSGSKSEGSSSSSKGSGSSKSTTPSKGSGSSGGSKSEGSSSSSKSSTSKSSSSSSQKEESSSSSSGSKSEGSSSSSKSSGSSKSATPSKGSGSSGGSKSEGSSSSSKSSSSKSSSSQKESSSSSSGGSKSGGTESSSKSSSSSSKKEESSSSSSERKSGGESSSTKSSKSSSSSSKEEESSSTSGGKTTKSSSGSGTREEKSSETTKESGTKFTPPTTKTVKEVVKCPYITRYDQPLKYDMFPKPFEFDKPADCCLKCYQTPKCKSWVYHTSTKLCHLKKAYYPKESRIRCEDCIAYDKSESPPTAFVAT